jgi:hypothetical protein
MISVFYSCVSVFVIISGAATAVEERKHLLIIVGKATRHIHNEKVKAIESHMNPYHRSFCSITSRYFKFHRI